MMSGDPSIEEIRSVHRALFGSIADIPTPLVHLPSLAAEIGVQAVYLKDESTRLGMGAFKVLGASWAICSLLAERYGVKVDDIDTIREKGRAEGITIYAATAGNHGRAVAKTATLLNLPSRIYVPSATEEWSRHSMVQLGAECIAVEGDYDTAYQRCAADCDEQGSKGLLVQDTSWEGYEDIPKRIIMGYTALFHELGMQLSSPPTHVIVPVGVGSLAHASVIFADSIDPSPRIITVEPESAACLSTSLAVGKSQTVQTGSSTMAGLNCGTVSQLSWPVLKEAVAPDDALVVDDSEVDEVMRELERSGLRVGACGAATVVAARQRSGWAKGDIVVLISSEGRVREILGLE